MPSQKLRPFLVLALAAFVSSSADCQTTQLTAVPLTVTAELPSFTSRMTQFYALDWKPDLTLTPLPAPARRGLPSPLDSPPFFSADWGYSGSPTIGEPDTSSYPLSSAIGLAHSRIKVFGWIEPSINVSTSSNSNAPAGDLVFANRLHLDRAVLIVERLPDTVQQDHVDWGFHLTNLFGTDYRYNVGKGYLSSQLLDHGRQYGYDTPFDYFDLYLPHVAQGMNIRIGRFASVPGIESQVPPFNYMFSHSLLNITDPVTDTGIMTTFKLNDQWLVQLGVTGGHDVALWSGDAKPSATACLNFTTKSVNDNLYACANGINDGKYAYNNVQQYDLTWYHKFSHTWHLSTEAWFMYEREVPSISATTLTPEKGANAAYCHPGLLRCTAPEYAIVSYLQKQLSAHDFVSLRAEVLNDKKGQRTGFQSRYTESTLSWNHWFGSTVQLRPELRFERSWDATAYDGGSSKNQFVAATDIVFHY